jgi:hypothetical protein
VCVVEEEDGALTKRFAEKEKEQNARRTSRGICFSGVHGEVWGEYCVLLP